MADLLPSLRLIPIKKRLSVLYIERGQLDVLDGASVVVDVTDDFSRRVRESIWEGRSPHSRG